MALREASPEEVGNRVAVVRLLSTLTSRELAACLGSKSASLATQLENGQSRVIERITSIANVCAGEGLLHGATPEEVARFLRFESDELTIDPLVWDASENDVRQPSLTILTNVA